MGWRTSCAAAYQPVVKDPSASHYSEPMSIARLSVTALDCPDPHALAAFYSAITGWPIRERDDDEWVQLVSDTGATLAFQRVPAHVAPTWPDGNVPQQLHCDFECADLDVAEAEVLALGAVKATTQPMPESFRVYLDPVGHPFCLVLDEPE